MKKTTRYILVILSLLLLCVALTACNPVPEMRKNHATWNEDGSISFNGKTYLQLPTVDHTFSPIIDNNHKAVWVTKPDVPVLLSKMMGQQFYSAQQGDFLTNYVVDYCDSEIYDAMVQSIQAGAPMQYYCFEYAEYNMEKEYVETTRLLISEDLTAVFKSTFSQKPVELPPGANLEYDEEFAICHCSKDMVFCVYAFQLLYNSFTQTCYLMVDDKEEGTIDYYLLDEQYLPLLKEEIPFLS